MATAASTYTWALTGVALKAYLGVSGSTEDTNLTLWLASASEDCDDFVGADAFVDDDGVDITHPTKIRLGIYEWVKAFRAWYQTRTAGIASVRTRSLSESYNGAEGAAIARAAARDLWQASMTDVSLLG